MISENVFPVALGMGSVVPGPSRAGQIHKSARPSHTVEDSMVIGQMLLLLLQVSEGLLGPFLHGLWEINPDVLWIILPIFSTFKGHFS